ncbi:MAG: phage tail tape measure protein [Bacteroides sp.]|nr:phage tail tape measure protein [Bacteroides sp.]
MGVSTSDFRIALRIDNADAARKLQETKNEISKLKEEMKKLADAGKKDTDEYKQMNKTLDELNVKAREYRKEAGRTGYTYNELRQQASKLRRELHNTVPGTEKWKQLQADLKIADGRLKEVRASAQGTSFSLGKLADGFNRYAAIGASAVATLTGMALTVRGCVNDFAEMEEAESQVTKYTGMAKDEVKALNEEFKKMDTRTPRTELNELAGTAGRLGIQAKEDVLEFVEAADMINVALGEDLGEDAIKNIGKLSDMFGDSSKSMKENMLAIGSAVNSVAQNSSASEPYLVEFTARMGGVAKQANLAITDVMGFASALDQNMLRSEMASTALSGLIMKIYQEPAKYAKLAGMDVKEFTDLMEKDVNAAILSFLESLGNLGGMNKMAPVLKEMKLSGAEAAGVISTLAGNVAKVRKEQRQASEAFAEGTSIVNEFNVQNNTVQAELDKAKERFADIRRELGEQLLPVMKYMVSTGSLTVKGLSAVVSVLFEYKGAILTAGTAIATYTLLVNGATMATKAYEGITKLATLTTNLFSKATKLSPWGLLISGVTAAVGYFTIFRDSTDKNTQSLKGMNAELSEAESRLNRMGDIDLRAKNLDTLNDRQKQDLKQDAEAEIRVIEDKLAKETALFRKYYQEQKATIEARTDIDDRAKRALIRGLDHEAHDKAVELNALLEEKKKLVQLVNQLPSNSRLNIGTPTIEPDEKELDEQYQAELKLLEKAQNEKLTQIKWFHLQGISTEEQYQQEMYRLELDSLFKRQELNEKYGKDASDLQVQVMDKMLAEADRKYAELQKKAVVKPTDIEVEDEVEEDNYLIEKFKQTLDGQRAILEAHHESGLISEQEYQDELTRINAEAEEKRQEKRIQSTELVSQAFSQVSNIVQSLQDLEVSKVERSYDKKIKAAKTAGKDTTKLEEEKEAAVLNVKKKYADKQFLATAFQIVADTAAAVMKAWAELGPIAGPIFGALAAAQGAIQLAVANEQRQAAKGLKSGGYSSDYVEGYTSRGDSDDVAGVIPVHKNEFVANHVAVANPHVKRFLDVFDLAQKDGSIRWIDTTQILERTRTRAGRYSGGYSGQNAPTSVSSVASGSDGQVVQLLNRIIILLQTGNENTSKMANQGIPLDVRTIRDGLKKLDRLEANVSR